ncbi:MAG: MSHA biogenesis protein MshQ [Psychromonas sp.]|jgi:MSHA biogenesis protein MshQ|uniref:DUF6701 domain-containing protein n=1 Tax=Psychromonas sp. TaxID=1884585 RepID=UPI0039E360B5
MKYLTINFLLLLSLFFNTAQAATVIDEVLLNDASAITVASGAEIKVTITVILDNNSKWKSTSYTFGGVTSCIDTGNYHGNWYWNNTYTTDFYIKAPAVAGGYDVIFDTYEKNNCNGSSSYSKALNEGLTVTLPEPVLPIAEYRFDECEYTGMGPEVIDQTGSHPATTRGGAVNTFDYGQIQRAVELTDKDQHVETSIPLSANFSVSTWFKRPTSNTNNPYFVLGAMQYGGDLLYLDRNNDWHWGVYNADTGSKDGGFSFADLDNNWHHLVLVYSGGKTQLYIDGTYKDSVNRAPTGTLKYIGTSFDGVTSNNAQGFRAPLDEFIVFDSVLTASQIHSIYTNQNAEFNYDRTTREPVNCSLSPLVEWRMDENGWDGTVDQVIDSTGNDKHGTAQNSLSTTNDAHICRAGEFNGINDYIESSDIYDVLSNTASMSFWIKTSQTGNNTAWRAPGISGVEQNGGTDDIFWGWIDASGNIGISVGDDNSSKSNSAINDGSFHHIVLTRDAVTGAYKIYIDGSLNKSGTIGTGLIGTAFSSIGRIEGGNGYFEGQLDELKIYDSVLSDAQVTDLYNETRICDVEQIDHYEIIHDGSGLTCAPETVTINACTNSDCTSLSTEEVSVNFQVKNQTSPTLTTIISPLFIGSSSLNLSHTLAETLTLSLANPSISPIHDFVCNDGSGSSCDLVFADTGFRFLVEKLPEVIPNAISEVIPTQLSGKPSNTGYNAAVLSLQAIKTNPVSGACEAALTDNINIEMAAQCKNPTTCAGQQVSINSSTIPTLANSASLSYSNISLDFGNSNESSAIFVFNYPDAGKIQLHARYNIPVDDTPTGNYMSGNSNSFVVKPLGFYVEVTGNPAAEGAGDAAFKKAGETFSTTLTAMQWQTGNDSNNDGQPDSNDALSDNSVTPNFGNEITPATANLTPTLLLPTPGNNPPLLNSSFTNFNSGSRSRSDLSWAEVGIISLDASSSYLDSNNVLGDLPFLGRFIPDHFVLTATENGALSGGNPFVYSGQMISADAGETVGQISYATKPEFTITAKSKCDSPATCPTTKNYTGNFMKLLIGGISSAVPTKDATRKGADGTNNVNLTAKLTDPITLPELDGVINYQFNSTDNFVYTRDSNAIIAPFSAGIDLQITSITDSDGVVAEDIDADITNGVLTMQPLGVEIRFGRWVMENSYGPETSDLRIPMAVQYWDGSDFIRNISDSFSTFDAIDANIIDNELVPAAPDPTIWGLGQFFNGETNRLTISSPGTNIRGSVTVRFSVPAWLQFDWNNDDGLNNGPYNDNPSAQATFGLYRGNDRIIYRREVFE